MITLEIQTQTMSAADKAEAIKNIFNGPKGEFLHSPSFARLISPGENYSNARQYFSRKLKHNDRRFTDEEAAEVAKALEELADHIKEQLK